MHAIDSRFGLLGLYAWTTSCRFWAIRVSTVSETAALYSFHKLRHCCWCVSFSVLHLFALIVSKKARSPRAERKQGINQRTCSASLNPSFWIQTPATILCASNLPNTTVMCADLWFQWLFWRCSKTEKTKLHQTMRMTKMRYCRQYATKMENNEKS